ncbi:hypothetical protein [Tenacibaculum maritimum]|uniref:hypothetical protein n=2 Tax=Tenacibaculum maritimum TaxID=107401 RepID=UPI0010A3AF32|nr:hypothetical protein [Tenacibaculum maritimum]MCD9564290.1 hypothetical protein [Tenacibaculum maritimum]MCD9567049.1 hypothetical protein [Tenacibaculum maritimum]MCD9580332.1 hypothetical protein [Tenacibaculum maritimum]MCD9583249.1 hypothetical protein [Tenacibaculum maritimum]MCD9586236.1 hypothetical protein [Tenacibaculum maritimum]
MRSRIQELKINSAKNKIIKNYDFLDIKSIYSSLDKEHKIFYDSFNKLNFNTEIFPFNKGEGGEIDDIKFKQQHIKAIDLFTEKINNFKKTDNAYITIGFNGIGFWIEIDVNSFNCNLQRFIKEYGANFYFYALKSYGLQIYRAEYQWEVLSTF